MQPLTHIVDDISELTPHDRKNLVAALRELLETSVDATAGYETAAGSVHEPELAQLFHECAAERRISREDLTQLLTELGETAAAHGSIGGEIHRMLIAIRGALAKGDPANLLSECERGEHVALGRYERAIQLRMPQRVASVLLDQTAQVRAARISFDRMRHPW